MFTTETTVIITFSFRTGHTNLKLVLTLVRTRKKRSVIIFLVFCQCQYLNFFASNQNGLNCDAKWNISWNFFNYKKKNSKISNSNANSNSYLRFNFKFSPNLIQVKLLKFKFSRPFKVNTQVLTWISEFLNAENQSNTRRHLMKVKTGNES